MGLEWSKHPVENTFPCAVNLLHFLFLLIKQAADSCRQSLGIAEECSVSKGSPGLFWAAAWEQLLRWDIHGPARNSTGNLLLSLGANVGLLQGERRTHVSLVQKDGKASPAFGGSSWKISVCFLITPSLSAGAWDSCKAVPVHWGKPGNSDVPIIVLLFKLALNTGDFCPVLVLHMINSCVGTALGYSLGVKASF